MVFLIVLCLGVKMFCAVGALCMLPYLPPIGKIAAHSAYDVFFMV